jgi:hypothetical protein
MINWLDLQYIHTFTQKDEVLGERECTIEVDDPGLDATDGAHPAWWRGSDHACQAIARNLNSILDGVPAYQCDGDYQEAILRIKTIVSEIGIGKGGR